MTERALENIRAEYTLDGGVSEPKYRIPAFTCLKNNSRFIPYFHLSAILKICSKKPG